MKQIIGWCGLIGLLALGACSTGNTWTKADDEAIRSIMQRQQDCWNKGDLACFMNGYWESDSLRFIGSKGLTYGWDQTLANYERSYPDRDAMGTLTFELISVEGLGPNAALVIGKWHLARTKGDLSGHFSLTWKRHDGQWVIVADHSS